MSGCWSGGASPPGQPSQLRAYSAGSRPSSAATRPPEDFLMPEGESVTGRRLETLRRGVGMHLIRSTGLFWGAVRRVGMVNADAVHIAARSLTRGRLNCCGLSGLAVIWRTYGTRVGKGRTGLANSG